MLPPRRSESVTFSKHRIREKLPVIWMVHKCAQSSEESPLCRAQGLTSFFWTAAWLGKLKGSRLMRIRRWQQPQVCDQHRCRETCHSVRQAAEWLRASRPAPAPLKHFAANNSAKEKRDVASKDATRIIPGGAVRLLREAKWPVLNEQKN